MKVKELIDLLEKCDPRAEVIMQRDPEGNGYSPLSVVDGDAVYVPDTDWSGEVYSTDWSADDAAMDEEDWADLMDEPRCVVLAPLG